MDALTRRQEEWGSLICFFSSWEAPPRSSSWYGDTSMSTEKKKKRKKRIHACGWAGGCTYKQTDVCTQTRSFLGLPSFLPSHRVHKSLATLTEFKFPSSFLSATGPFPVDAQGRCRHEWLLTFEPHSEENTAAPLPQHVCLRWLTGWVSQQTLAVPSATLPLLNFDKNKPKQGHRVLRRMKTEPLSSMSTGLTNINELFDFHFIKTIKKTFEKSSPTGVHNCFPLWFPENCSVLEILDLEIWDDLSCFKYNSLTEKRHYFVGWLLSTCFTIKSLASKSCSLIIKSMQSAAPEVTFDLNFVISIAAIRSK